MVIKHNNNKSILMDNLKNEDYIISNISDFKNTNFEEDKNIIIKSSVNKKTDKIKNKNSYIEFIKKKTEEYKINKPELKGAERRKEILNLWKLEKESKN